MTGEVRPLLALGPPVHGDRIKQRPRAFPGLKTPGAGAQGERLSPQFRRLAAAFEQKRAALVGERADELDPELVVVFDLAGTVEQFANAVKYIPGLEFLTEHLDEALAPDDDFYLVDQGVRIDKEVTHSLYMVMSNVMAGAEIVRLFDLSRNNPDYAFPHGLGSFKQLFEQLRDIRRWGPEDRIRDTGLLDAWREHLLVVGGSHSDVQVEIELWHRREPGARAVAEAALRDVVASAGGEVIDACQIGQIGYHALLVSLPVHQVQQVLDRGTSTIALMNSDEIMFVNPFSPMTVGDGDRETFQGPEVVGRLPDVELPRVALLDGMPMANHDILSGRIMIDDPDGIGADYPVEARRHGTAMASLINRGDLSAPGEPLSRPLYVRPIMRPHGLLRDREQVVGDVLLVDLVHRAIRRLVEGEGGREPAAPSVRIVNLSIGVETRAFVRRMSPLGRLLDWLAEAYNLLFIVSAGNHLAQPLMIPAEGARDVSRARDEALKAAKGTGRLRGIMPPGDSLNALTVGSAHADGAGQVDVPDTVWDLVDEGVPALYGAVGPGVGRSIKPEIYHDGGRGLYRRPVVSPEVEMVALEMARTERLGPGIQVAAPDRSGTTSSVAYTHGTSNATALVTREASRLFDLLELGPESSDDFPFPDPVFHPVLVKALLVHASSWGQQAERMLRRLSAGGEDLDPRRVRRELTTLLGYGKLDSARLGRAAINRAVLIAGGRIGREERQTFEIPLPLSLRARAEWRRFTVTLAFVAPTVGHLTRYRGAKVYFDKLGGDITGGARIDADHNAVRRGACQHEIVEGGRATVFADDGNLPIHVQCMDDALRLPRGQMIRYGLVVSVETSVTTSTTIHDEIRARLQAQARDQVSSRLRST